MTVYGFYSAGGFAREVKASLAASLAANGDTDFEIVFIDDDAGKIGTTINGSRVLSYDAFKALDDKRINVAFADTRLRQTKVQQATQDDIPFFSVTAQTHISGENVTKGIGGIYAHHSMVTSDAVIGDHFHCNIYSYVAHDCVVGDFVTLAPRVSLNGRVVVEDNVYVGSDATILPGKDREPLVIGRGAIVGAGAVVTRSVEPGQTVVGNPARAFNR